tara:strand:- start:1923 stop:2729 length:807 start_codon:yes stop_codon:yes gene_type:complete
MKSLIKEVSLPILSRIKRFRNIHKGESCYLFGDGISIKYFDLNKFTDKISIPCGFLLFHNDFNVLNTPYAQLIETYYFYPFIRLNRNTSSLTKISLNKIQNQYRKEINKRSDIEFFINLSNFPVFFNKNITYIFKDIPDDSVEDSFISNKFNCYEGSLRAQILLAIYMGFDDIFLVGHDYTHYPVKSHHWYEKGHGVITPIEDYNKDFLNYAKNFINITTITIDSEISDLDYVRYEDAFGVSPIYRENTEILAPKYLDILATQPYNIF